MDKSKPVNTFKIMRVLLIIVVIYLLLTNYDMDHSSIPQSFDAPTIDEIGTDQDKGNFIGIQPFMEPIDYASDSNFFRKLNHYFSAAQSKDLLNEKSIVVLPEHIGTWLVAQNERKLVYTSNKIEEAMRAVVVRNLLSFLPEYFSADEEDQSKAAVFRVKSTQMAISYAHVMRSLASRYRVTVVGGSIILPSPKVEIDSLLVESGPLYNASFVFYPNGSLDPQITKKAFPVMDEQTIIASAKPEELPVYNTQAGDLAVMICADSWYLASYETAQKKGATLLAIPSYSTGDKLWATKWKGYNGAPSPPNVDASDIGNITEEMAWLKYSMGGRAQQAGIVQGINVFLRGNLWDMGSDGKTISMKEGGLKMNDADQKSTITCLWF
ncbi:MAG: nitrilase-related carbon-nitrogen hydrolase [Cyclobacteriaceae bacterium]